MNLSKYDFENLKNESQNVVLAELERQLSELSEPLCLCNECVLDMAALTLNVVKPLYRVSLLGSLYTASAMEQEDYADSVREAVSNAIEKVRQNPGHEVHEEAAQE